MTVPEAAKLLTLIAAYDNRTFDELAATTWARGLGGLAFADCVEAIHAHYRTSAKWAMVADIRQQVTRLGNLRVEAAESRQFKALEGSPVGREKADERLAQVRAMGLRFGRLLEADPIHPTVDPEAARVARGHSCPWCKAAPSQPCTTPASDRPLSTLHLSRLEQETSAA